VVFHNVPSKTPQAFSHVGNAGSTPAGITNEIIKQIGDILFLIAQNVGIAAG